MILETIVTTLSVAGDVNVAPMGVEWGEDTIVVKPFLETTTFRNLRDTRAAIVNITDDVLVFAQAAVSNPRCDVHPATRVRGVVLAAATSWRELEVEHIDATPPRSRIEARVVHHGTQREFIGFNRARFAVLETAILATRTHLLPAVEIRAQLEHLQTLVDKTAGPREREAMRLLRREIDVRLGVLADASGMRGMSRP